VLAGPLEVAVVGRRDDPGRAELHRAALAGTSPGAVVLAGEPGETSVPLLRDRPLVDDRATAYVCRGFVCERPVTDAADVRRLVGARRGDAQVGALLAERPPMLGQ
ncbi:MAG: hypothetical protein M3P83_08325, partial [Actinomycetota bacterium]|nr:hypothetical protein [Actinomycetota bacterium]